MFLFRTPTAVSLKINVQNVLEKFNINSAMGFFKWEIQGGPQVLTKGSFEATNDNKRFIGF